MQANLPSFDAELNDILVLSKKNGVFKVANSNYVRIMTFGLCNFVHKDIGRPISGVRPVYTARMLTSDPRRDL